MPNVDKHRLSKPTIGSEIPIASHAGRGSQKYEQQRETFKQAQLRDIPNSFREAARPTGDPLPFCVFRAKRRSRATRVPLQPKSIAHPKKPPAGSSVPLSD